MEIVFKKIASGKGRPTKFIRLDDGTEKLYNEWLAETEAAIQEKHIVPEIPADETLNIFFKKVGEEKGRPSKFIRLDDGTEKLYNEMMNEINDIRRVQKLLIKTEIADVLSNVIEASPKKHKEHKEVKAVVALVIDENDPHNHPHLEIDTLTCSDEDFEKFIKAHKRAVGVGNRPSNLIYK